jgi:hypothetical protein
LKVNSQLWEKVHPLDQDTNVAGSAHLDVQIVADFPARGDQIFTIVSGKPDKIVMGDLVAAFFILSKGLCTKMSESNISKYWRIRLILWSPDSYS